MADQIAKHADFFSFGTNDLTQATFSFSREDAENKFLPQYVESGILPENPFEALEIVANDVLHGNQSGFYAIFSEREDGGLGVVENGVGAVFAFKSALLNVVRGVD